MGVKTLYWKVSGPPYPYNNRPRPARSYTGYLYLGLWKYGYGKASPMPKNLSNPLSRFGRLKCPLEMSGTGDAMQYLPSNTNKNITVINLAHADIFLRICFNRDDAISVLLINLRFHATLHPGILEHNSTGTLLSTLNVPFRLKSCLYVTG